MSKSISRVSSRKQEGKGAQIGTAVFGAVLHVFYYSKCNGFSAW